MRGHRRDAGEAVEGDRWYAMNNTNNPNLKPYAQKLRREMTKEERHLWYDYLKFLPVTVKRQMVIGPYIVDFYIAEAKLVIELDGSQHYLPEERAADAHRSAFLESRGLQVLRFSNYEVDRRFVSVCEAIHRAIQARLQ